MTGPRLLGASLLLASLPAGCSYPHPEEAAELWLSRLARAPAPPPGDEWPVSPAEAERLFSARSLALRGARRTRGGNTGASRGTLVADGRAIEVKWKAAPPGTAEGWNNTPRREMAAYEIQKWFLRPEDYVVPTSAARCLPLETLRASFPAAKPTLPDTRCTVGTVSLWLDNLTLPNPLYDAERFARDANYAHHIANLNVLTYLIEHEDARHDNFLVSEDEDNRRVFSIDNGITFGELRHNYLVINWDELHVPALPARTVRRLRDVRREDVDALASILVLVADDDGMLRPVPSIPEGAGVPHLQFGLQLSERDALWRRIGALLDRVDRGEIPTF
jgi:hypothetical protein